MTTSTTTIANKTQRPLPPAGDARREELLRRRDELQAQLGELDVEAGRINPEILKKVEPELAQYFNMMEVSNPDPAYKYFWIFTGQHQQRVKWKLSQGAEVVQGDMPECLELRGLGADTTRRIGDVILMRMRVDRYKLLQRQREKTARTQREGVETVLRDMGDRYRRYGVKVRNTAEMSEEENTRLERTASRR